MILNSIMYVVLGIFTVALLAYVAVTIWKVLSPLYKWFMEAPLETIIIGSLIVVFFIGAYIIGEWVFKVLGFH